MPLAPIYEHLTMLNACVSHLKVKGKYNSLS